MLSGKSTTATAKVEAPAAKPLPLSINSTSFMYGPQLSNPGVHSSADSEIGALQPMYIRNQIGFSYKLDAKSAITPVLDFDLITADAGGNAANEGFHWRDSFVKLNRSGLAEANLGGNTLTLDGDVRFYVPTSLASRTNNKIGALRVSMNPSLQIGKSKWSLSAVNFAKYHFQSKDESAPGKALARLDVYAGPQINYEFNSTVTAFLLYEATTTWNTAGIPDYINYATSNSDIEPGVNLNLHERLSLTPTLNWYTNQKLSTTSFVLVASIKLL